jgi:hypothetical protein
MSKSTKKVHWNEDTVDHFKLMTSYSTPKEVLEEVIDFVEADCTPEKGETENDLILDLMLVIYEVEF